MKYRGIAVADTARERPVLTVQLLDKQQRLTVSTIEDKRLALLAGLGWRPCRTRWWKNIEAGRLRVVGPEYSREADIIMAGGATAWGGESGSCAKFRACSRSANVGGMRSLPGGKGFCLSRRTDRGRAARPDPAPARWK